MFRMVPIIGKSKNDLSHFPQLMAPG